MPLPGEERKWVSNLYARPQSNLAIGGGPQDAQTIARNVVARQNSQGQGAQSSNLNDYFAKRQAEKNQQALRLSQMQQKKDQAIAFGQKYADMHTSAQQTLQQKWAAEDAAKAAQAQQDQWKAQNPTHVSSGQGVSGQVYTGNPSRDSVLSAAAAQVGTPYAWGGGGYGVAGSAGRLNGPNGSKTVIGFDCSGLVSYALSTMGIKLPSRQSEAILGAMGNKTNFGNAAPGDIVGWYDNSADGYKRHIALKYSDTQIIEATPGGVRIRNIGGGYDKGIFAVHLNY